MPRYGRVPDETADLFKRTIALVRSDVVTAIPGSAPAKVEAFTLEAVLDVVLRDWRENDNTDGLLPADVADLRSFIELAHAASSPDPYGRGFPIYQATLTGLLEDWLANWNAPGNPGPPNRYGRLAMMIFDINVIHTLTRLLSAVGWALFGVVLLFFCLRLYDRLDPIDYRAEIERGNVAAAITHAAVALALAAFVIAAIVT